MVDHTPALFYKTFTWNNSELLYPYLERLIADDIDLVLQKALIIKSGRIVDEEIKEFQKR